MHSIRNEGTADRIIRVILGISLLSLVYLLHGPVRWVGLIGLVLLVTGLVGTCPMYMLLGLRTCATRQK